jgi:hypothetical protein
MKKRNFFIALFLAIVLAGSAQVPQKFNYQAVVRDGQHALIANQDVGFRMSIVEGAPGGAPVYVETHTVSTNAFGMADLVIGEGSVVSGDFGSVPWGTAACFLKVEVDPSGGTAYEHIGTSQLISVPYAIYSGNITSPTRKFTIQEDAGHPVDSALFEVRNAEGQTVFAVYPEGTRVYILDEEGKGVKRGFAIGGYSRTTKGVTQEYMRVTPDSIRLYFDEEATKGVKGGFAIGGYSRTSKRPTDQYFMLKPDSAKFLMVSETPDLAGSSALTVTTKSRTGGEEDSGANLFKLTRENYFIGHLAGSSNTTGYKNCFIGYESGHENTTGFGNLFLGEGAGWSNRNGTENIFIGVNAGHGNTSGYLNTAVGFHAGFETTKGYYNAMFGFWAGSQNAEGNHNTYIGAESGRRLENGNENTFLGAFSGNESTAGNLNVFVGMRAGSNVGSNYNTLIGSYSGVADNAGNNVFIGSSSGREATGQNNTFIGNNSGLLNKGNFNVFLGLGSGQNLEDGGENTFIGAFSGVDVTTGIHNVFVGMRAGSAVGSDGNTLIGAYAGNDTTNAGNNVFVGFSAGRVATGEYNTFVGEASGFRNKGNANVFLGRNSGANCENGSNNIFIGEAAGFYNDGNRNVFVGYNAGINVKGSETFIVNSSDGDSTSALIWGKFDQDILRLNNRVGIGRNPVEHALEVEGTVSKTDASSWLVNSDARIKTEVRDIDEALEQILKLHPVKFRYTDGWRALHPSIRDIDHYNFIAQEFQEVFPDAVQKSSDSIGEEDALLQMDSYPAQVVAIRAIQELAGQNRELAIENREQQALIDQLMQKVTALEEEIMNR